MNIFIAGQSSIKYWIRKSLDSCPFASSPIRDRLDIWGFPLARITHAGSSIPSNAQSEALRRDVLEAIPQPVEFLVRDAKSRLRSAERICHTWSKPIPPNSFVRVDRGVYVSTPEFAFRQMAHGLSFHQVAHLAYELCSTYIRSDNDARGFRSCSPLSSTALLHSYLVQGGHALKHLVTPLNTVADGAASPMETLVALLLCLPKTRGGFGLPSPELNGRIDLPVPTNTNASSHYRCDLLWRDQHVAVEYDSDTYHTGADRIAHDARRRNDLINQGYTVITITKAQLFDALSFCKVARQIESLLRTADPRRRNSYDWDSRYNALRHSLLKPDWLWHTGV